MDLSPVWAQKNLMKKALAKSLTLRALEESSKGSPFSSSRCQPCLWGLKRFRDGESGTLPPLPCQGAKEHGSKNILLTHSQHQSWTTNNLQFMAQWSIRSWRSNMIQHGKGFTGTTQGETLCHSTGTFSFQTLHWTEAGSFQPPCRHPSLILSGLHCSRITTCYS